MYAKANPGRDRFTFSLGGMAATSSYVFTPAVADDEINKAWDERLGREPIDQPDTAREIEGFLARYFAPGCRQAA